jgi:hypothetical protein
VGSLPRGQTETKLQPLVRRIVPVADHSELGHIGSVHALRRLALLISAGECIKSKRPMDGANPTKVGPGEDSAQSRMRCIGKSAFASRSRSSRR